MGYFVSEVFTADVLDDGATFVVVAQVHGRFTKKHRVPTVIGKVITAREIQDSAFSELIARTIPERLDDAGGRAVLHIPNIRHSYISQQASVWRTFMLLSIPHQTPDQCATRKTRIVPPFSCVPLLSRPPLDGVIRN